MKKLVTAAAALMLSSGCHSAPAPSATPVSPASTTIARVQDPGHALLRFTNDIWPAVMAYKGAPDQGSDGYRRYIPIIEQLDATEYRNLSTAVQHLGVLQGPDGPDDEIRSDHNGLTLANAHVTAETSDTAAILACYTFVATELRLDDKLPTKTPAASEATFELHKTREWQLHAITNNHVVPDCTSTES